MKSKFIKDWDNFVETSSEFMAENTHKSRVTLKYRNKAPSNGNLYVTDDNKSFRYKFTEKSGLDKLDLYIKSLLHMFTNKPVEESAGQMAVEVSKSKESKKKSKKTKKH